MVGEFFASSVDGIDDELLRSGPDGRFATVAANGLTPVTVATLGEILGAGNYREILALAAAEHVEDAGGASGIFALPESVRTHLAHADDLAVVAVRWAATDELRLSYWTDKEANRVLRELHQLAQRTQEPVWYWWSL